VTRNKYSPKRPRRGHISITAGATHGKEIPTEYNVPEGATINNRGCNPWPGNKYSPKRPRRGQLLITMGATRGKETRIGKNLPGGGELEIYQP